MRNIITLTLFLLLSNNAFACYDENLSDSTNFNQCTAEAKQGDATAQFNLAAMYEQGLGVAQDDKTAVIWYTKAADQGYARAQNNLGLMYANGRGVAQDNKKAVEWLTKAAEQGNPKALKALASLK